MSETPQASVPGSQPPPPENPTTVYEPAQAQPSAGSSSPAPAVEAPKPDSASLLSEAPKQPAPKPDDKQAQAQAKDPAAPVETLGADIQYEFKIPTELQSQRDPEREKTFTETLRKHRISREGGQDLLDRYIQERSREETLRLTNWQRTNEQWRNEVQNDPEIGGARFDSTLNNCRALVSKYGSDQLREVLNSTGAGNHPALVKFLNNVANDLARLRNSPRPVPAAKPVPQKPPSRAERRYTSGSK